ncbi:hypothetical protein [Methylovulum miyakonense]|uniref:hypothetical protein n=1 Tax=Methylovulum miyakonense TaxID=645578 RepID=UPI0003674DAC|nr:hypothetical protein [Methylovulum miyakonense]
MKDSNDNLTIELFPSAGRGRGRPKSPNSLSNADRQRLHREKRKQTPAVPLGGLTPDEQHQVEKFLRDYRQPRPMSLTGSYHLLKAEMEAKGCSDASIVDLETLWRYAVAGL